MGSSIVRVSDERTDALTLPVARLLVDAINETVEEPRKRFGTIGPGPRGSYARAVVEQLGKPALVFESTWTEERELRVAKQVLLLDTLLAELGML
jgi:hypothetical protein